MIVLKYKGQLTQDAIGRLKQEIDKAAKRGILVVDSSFEVFTDGEPDQLIILNSEQAQADGSV